MVATATNMPTATFFTHFFFCICTNTYFRNRKYKRIFSIKKKLTGSNARVTQSRHTTPWEEINLHAYFFGLAFNNTHHIYRYTEHTNVYINTQNQHPINNVNGRAFKTFSFVVHPRAILTFIVLCDVVCACITISTFWYTWNNIRLLNKLQQFTNPFQYFCQQIVWCYLFIYAWWWKGCELIQVILYYLQCEWNEYLKLLRLWCAVHMFTVHVYR